MAGAPLGDHERLSVLGRLASQHRHFEARARGATRREEIDADEERAAGLARPGDVVLLARVPS